MPPPPAQITTQPCSSSQRDLALLEDALRRRRRHDPADAVAVGLEDPALLRARAVGLLTACTAGRSASSGPRTPDRRGRPRSSSAASRAAARTAAGCRAPARQVADHALGLGAEDVERVVGSGLLVGRASSASRPICGPLPWEITSSCSARSAPGGRRRRATLARWFSDGHRLARAATARCPRARRRLSCAHSSPPRRSP